MVSLGEKGTDEVELGFWGMRLRLVLVVKHHLLALSWRLYCNAFSA